MNRETITISIVPALLVIIAATVIIFDQNRTINSLLKNVTACYDSVSECERVSNKWSVYLLSELIRTKRNLYQMTEVAIRLEKQIYESEHQYVTVTSNHPPSRGINSDKDPERVATMKKPVPGYTLAVSDELFNIGWLGKKIYIDGWGVGKATDRMDHTVKDKRIDICAPTLKWAKEFGIKKNVMAVILD